MDLARLDHVLIFGGSFDPPHRAHLALPRQVMETIGADAVAYVPAARPPLKPDHPPAPAKHRLAMLELALAGREHALILTDELDRAADGEPSYTIHTLERLTERLKPGARMRLLIGSDQALIFDQWKSHERIEQLAPPVVMVRPPETPRSLLTRLRDRRKWARRLVVVRRMNLSATKIRQRLARDEPIEEWVPGPVVSYIHEHGLYQAG